MSKENPILTGDPHWTGRSNKMQKTQEVHRVKLLRSKKAKAASPEPPSPPQISPESSSKISSNNSSLAVETKSSIIPKLVCKLELCDILCIAIACAVLFILVQEAIMIISESIREDEC